MLYSLESGQYIKDIPHIEDYNAWRKILGDDEYRAIIDELNGRIEGEEIVTSSWIPGKDWTGSVFEPIYSKACGGNRTAAKKFLGILVWEVILNHPDTWSFVSNGDIAGKTYFKVDPSKIKI